MSHFIKDSNFKSKNVLLEKQKESNFCVRYKLFSVSMLFFLSLVVTSRGHEDLIHHSNDHSTLPIMEDDGSALLVTAAPETGESSEVTGDRGMVSDPSEQTITLSLDAATQYLLQQQGIATQAIEMDDGTYQLFEQPVIQVIYTK